MKRTKQWAFALALALSTGLAWPEWIEIEKFDDGMRVFVDPSTARREGDTAHMLHLVRWGEPQLEDGLPPYLSTVVQTAYDCVSKREKYLASRSYAGPMGDRAEIVADANQESGWYSISETSMEDNLWKVACSRQGPGGVNSGR